MDKSADAHPGKGRPKEEYLNPKDDFSELGKIPNWRKVLSNFYIYPINIDDLTFNSVEHYYQGSKFQHDNPEYFKTFSLESDSPWSKDPREAKKMGGKHFLKHLKNFPSYFNKFKNVQLDSDFFTKHHSFHLKKALCAKFKKDGLPHKVLLNTKNAELWHGTRGVPASRQYILEEIRDEIQNTKDIKININIINNKLNEIKMNILN
jgi:predicted NAD-dependent protein-ADP-ribosyltransferase YbiA (DUF1768 family)